MAETLPVLDLALLELPNADQSPYLAELRTTARDVGFFYLINHGINPQLLQNVQSITQAFFALPDEEKQRVSMIHSPHFRGYNRAGVEYTREQRDQREQFDIGAERVALALQAGDPAWKRLQGPNLWPEALPQLRPVIHAWQQAMTGIALRLLRAFAKSLSLPPDAFDALYGTHPNEHVKLIRYPGQASDASQQGVGAHKDSGFLTFLLQDGQPGLQVEVTPGHWVDALPKPGAFVVNIGELLEIATNGYLRATVHRVVSPPARKERVSIAFFLGAQLDAEVPIYQLPPQLAAEAHGPTSDPANPLLREVGWNYLKGRLRSHRDVAARYYADAQNTVQS
ncbi:isopenicillin N synthase family oxygenase [Pantoea sp. EABMAA-21]|uniref:isopenicillin N synthase family dioxygenase n=1 Tax=unclassified Pantoea TaxID=2630326 RepID=UPI001325D555|nr:MULTISPECIES: isopenicillin N synthase family oxygenase [unclassified Pantoea]MDI9279100.1 isopenicillin N synthase family oxygenase [Pantoea sp. EABMAA-21]MXP54529.1 isopenicillin N synthase family oxygenase [Pantoea sp. Seng]